MDSELCVYFHQQDASDDDDPALRYDGYIDYGKELALLHHLLIECLANASISEVR